MTTNIQSIVWTPLGSDGQNRVATLKLDAGIDTLYNINNSGTGVGDDTAGNVEPKWVLIDNIQNNGYVTLTMGNFTIQIPPYQRESVGIPTGTRLIGVQLFAGSITITLSETRLADNQSNALLVSQTSVKTLIYGYKFLNATAAQVVADANTSILFSPTAADINYNLLLVSGSIGDGFYTRVQNGGNKIVSIVPAGADTINSPLIRAYDAANPLKLYPGDSGILTSDGFKWYYVADLNVADYWAFQPIGVPIPVWDHLAGILIPPTNRLYRYIKLTGADAYNTGVLSGEVTVGVFPLNTVTANIALAASPLLGQTVYLLNTMRAHPRPGSSGVFQQDNFQGHFVGGSSFRGGAPGGSDRWIWSDVGAIGNVQSAAAITDGVNGLPRFGNETREKNVGATYYMRIY